MYGDLIASIRQKVGVWWRTARGTANLVQARSRRRPLSPLPPLPLRRISHSHRPISSSSSLRAAAAPPAPQRVGRAPALALAAALAFASPLTTLVSPPPAAAYGGTEYIRGFDADDGTGSGNPRYDYYRREEAKAGRDTRDTTIENRRGTIERCTDECAKLADRTQKDASGATRRQL